MGMDIVEHGMKSVLLTRPAFDLFGTEHEANEPGTTMSVFRSSASVTFDPALHLLDHCLGKGFHAQHQRSLMMI